MTVSKISLLKNASTFHKRAQKANMPEEEVTPLQPVVDQKEPEQIWDALALSGSNNKAFLGLNNVDPTKFLTPERIADIEKSMAVFEKGVQKNLEVINQEFGGIGADLSESYKLELAAQMML